LEIIQNTKKKRDKIGNILAAGFYFLGRRRGRHNKSVLKM
jgi:hypothetical protein